jgi:hypothetical protein
MINMMTTSNIKLFSNAHMSHHSNKLSEELLNEFEFFYAETREKLTEIRGFCHDCV